jgi:hypothetical protein
MAEVSCYGQLPIYLYWSCINSLGAVVGVEDNGDAVDWCYAPDVVGCCNGSSNAGLLVLVCMVLMNVPKTIFEHVLTVDTLSGEESGLKDPTVSLRNSGFQV